jgi:hypothetical protein
VVAKDSKGQSTVVLDYVFDKPAPSKRPEYYINEDDYDEYDFISVNDNEPKEKSKPTKGMAPFKKAMGPLSIENIGLQYKGEKLGIVLDATFMLGPICLVLLGFGVRFPFGQKKKQQDATAQFDLSNIEVTLSGLIVSFDKPPLTVAGGFQHLDDGDFDCYAGGLTVAFKPWMIQAMGVYSKFPVQKVGVAPDPTKNPFTMVLVILKVDGPLFSVGFAEISGVTAGFGVNSAITLPTVETVFEFPFVKQGGVEEGASPIKTLQGLMDNK